MASKATTPAGAVAAQLPPQTVTRKIPRDAAVVMNVLRSMVRRRITHHGVGKTTSDGCTSLSPRALKNVFSRTLALSPRAISLSLFLSFSSTLLPHTFRSPPPPVSLSRPWCVRDDVRAWKTGSRASSTSSWSLCTVRARPSFPPLFFSRVVA